MSKKVAVVTPVFNRRELTLQCLRSLARVDRDGLEIEIFVVDDGSTDGTSEAVREAFPHVNLIEGDGNLWYTEGTNVGIAAALKCEPDYILMMNDDNVFDSAFLKNLINTAQSNDRSVVGALLLLWDKPHKVFQVSPRWETWSGGWHHWQHQTVWTVPDRPWEVSIIVGNCTLFPVEAIKENGLMDSGRFPMFGDAEYTPRLRRNGWKLLVDPHARVFCQPNDPPVRFRSLGLKDKLNGLFRNLTHPHNMKRRFYVCIEGAPSFLYGAIAFVVFHARLILGKNIEGTWAKSIEEPPLAETYSTAVVDRFVKHPNR